VGIPLGGHELDVPELPSASELRAFRRPVLLLAGEGDVYCPSAELRALGKELPQAEVVVLAGTDHFLWRREREAAERIADFAERIQPEG
jgi:pimeloyl-ACP methyl ester carboxylesterase